VIHLQRPLAKNPSVKLLEVRIRFTGLLVAVISMPETLSRFFRPRRVASTASASPTASVWSPGSDPLASAVENRSHGVLSCSRAHSSSVFFSSSGVFAPSIGL
jgi:hypothetical protein